MFDATEQLDVEWPLWFKYINSDWYKLSSTDLLYEHIDLLVLKASTQNNQQFGQQKKKTQLIKIFHSGNRLGRTSVIKPVFVENNVQKNDLKKK